MAEQDYDATTHISSILTSEQIQVKAQPGIIVCIRKFVVQPTWPHLRFLLQVCLSI